VTRAAAPGVIETGRLRLRPLAHADAGFIRALLNEPSFLRYIGDKGVRDEDDARRYLDSGPLASYARHGYGLLAVERREGELPIGICGLVRRDTLPGPDLGFAFLPAFWSRGYAFESAAAVLEDARSSRGLERVLAITSLDNVPSIRLLGRLGFLDEGTIRLPEEELRLFAWHAHPGRTETATGGGAVCDPS
jgi:ribosomal-protein-alanine N-acetyltransferase